MKYIILAIGTYDNAGGLKTVTDSYIRSFRDISYPIYWILIGSGKPPTEQFTDITYIQLMDGWNYYLNNEFVENDVLIKINQTIIRINAQLLFRPLQLTFEPYLSKINLPCIKMSLLVTAELIASAEKQPYILDKQFQSGVKADKIRLENEKKFYSAVDYLITNSKTTESALALHYADLKFHKKICSPPGADSIFFKTSVLNINNKVLYFGRFNHQKNIPSILKKVPKDWEFTVIGQGKWLKSDFEFYGIRYIDWEDKELLIKYLEEVTYCLFPSHYEPWGLSLNEALAAGRICIAQKNAGGHEEQIVDGKNGFVIDFKKNNFWDQIDLIRLNYQNNLQFISKNAKNSARKWDDHFTELIEFIKEIN